MDTQILKLITFLKGTISLGKKKKSKTKCTKDINLILLEANMYLKYIYEYDY